MRIENLVVTALGPFVQRTQINFKPFGNQGIYLVTGDTGAGKTSIFDAVTYALFKESSGKKRDVETLRSLYAEKDVPMSVELTFEYQGKRYLVIRSFKTKIKNKRNGTTEEEKINSVELHYLDGSNTIKSDKEADEALSQILPMKSNEFRQIIMIAQGDFTDLIQASTSRRKEILQKLFHTDIYDLLTKELKKQLELAEADYSQIDNLIKSALTRIEFADDDTEGKEKLAPFLALSSVWKMILKILDDLICQDEAKIAALTKEKNGLDKDWTENETAKKNFEQNQKTKRDYESAQGSLETAESQINKLQPKFDQLSHQKETVKDLAAQVTAMETLLPDYNARDEAVTKFSQNEKDIFYVNQEHDEIKKDQENLSRMIKKSNDRIAVLGNPDAQIASLENDRNEAQNRYEMLTLLKGDLATLDRSEKAQNMAQDVYRVKKLEADKAKLNYDRNYRLFLDAQAGILAETLNENQPCPVCGSVTHPHPANKMAQAPSEAELKTAQTTMDEKAKLMQNASKKAGEAYGQYKQAKEGCQKALDRLGLKISLAEAPVETERLLTEVNNEIIALNDKINTKKEDRAEKKRLEKNIRTWNESLETSRNALKDSEKSLARLNTEKKNIEVQLDAWKEKLSMTDSDAAKQEIERLHKEIQDTNDEIAQIEKKYKDCKEEKNRHIGTIEGLKKVVEGLPDEDQTQIDQQAQKLNERRQENERERIQAEKRLAINQGIFKEIEANGDKLEKADAKRTMLQRLSNTASGNGNCKIPLEVYAQTFYFERILYRANERLKIMSEGQYEFIRSEEAKGNSKTGLNLAVIDNYAPFKSVDTSDYIRPVESLSGGESFMAALSLALGLSQEIQAMAGGIQLNSMFIDEGFGTLDEKALDKAFQALNRVASSDQLIGIISHVGSLKDRIPNQIIVTKDTQRGSSVNVQY